MHIRTFRRAWAAACVNAGLGHEVREPDVIEPDGIVHKGRLVRRVTPTPHDFRRTAAMRLEDALGVRPLPHRARAGPRRRACQARWPHGDG